ncbi:MAG: hypothetical protein MSS63_01785 [Blautia glucerasea]|nr:hypothetical protein [Blautia glucerasea]MDY3087498.1 hypothetical protein [Blautia sp.]
MNKKKLVLPSIITLLAALIGIASFFLPYVSSTKEYKERINAVGDMKVEDDIDLTVSDLSDISLFKYTKVLYDYGDKIVSSDTKTFYIIFYISIGVVSLLVALCALGKRPILTLLLDIIWGVLIYLLNFDFIDRHIVPTDRSIWGIAHYIYYPVIAIVFVGAIWMFIAKHRIKKLAKSQSNI